MRERGVDNCRFNDVTNLEFTISFDPLNAKPILNFRIKITTEIHLCHLLLELKRQTSPYRQKALTDRNRSGLVRAWGKETYCCFSFRWRSRARAPRKCARSVRA